MALLCSILVAAHITWSFMKTLEKALGLLARELRALHESNRRGSSAGGNAVAPTIPYT